MGSVAARSPGRRPLAALPILLGVVTVWGCGETTTPSGPGGIASTNTCSPQACTISSVAGGVCLCNVQIAQGGSCEATRGLGGTIGTVCKIPFPPLATDRPCAQGLSCNNSV